MASSTGIPDPVLAGSLQLAGLSGPIEAVLDLPAADTWRDSPRAIALCCHPHPLFGGSLTNKVIHTVARSCATAGAIALRFNFRGVGRSAGTHDHGTGEALDVLTLAEQLRLRWPGIPLWLAGFSFGAWISLKTARELQPTCLLTVAPPVGRWDFSGITAPACPWLVVQGGKDELVDAHEVRKWVNACSDAATLVELPEADHFFHGQLLELRAAIDGFLETGVSASGDPRRI